jgi:hypothetical protein
MPDPGVKKAPNPGSGSATLVFGFTLLSKTFRAYPDLAFKVKANPDLAPDLGIFWPNIAVLRIRDPGMSAFLTPGCGMGESQHPDPGSGMNNPDDIFLSLKTIFLRFWG